MNLMDFPAQSLLSQQLHLLATGFYATVFNVEGTDVIVKVPKPDSLKHHEIEKRIYERLGHHPHLARFLGEVEIQDSASITTSRGLSFHLEPYGSLADILRTRKNLQAFPNAKNEYAH
jgi:hypothetical protein